MKRPGWFPVAVRTAEGPVFHGQARFVSARAIDGELGILAGHTPLVSALGAGVLRVVTSEGELTLAVAGGILQVDQDGVNVLASAAERAEDIDVERASAARKRALSHLEEPGQGHVRAQAALERALARLQAAGRTRH
ncbi:MAG: ATP synthase F1 subunit epsilon [Bacillota bacterium]